mgnify:FL=1
MKTELQLTVSENGAIEQNVHAFCSEVINQCKKYDYVVTEELLEQAKKDRTTLNKVETTISDKRKVTEKELMAQWTPLKKELMDTEKIVKSTANKIGEQINEFEEKVRLEKMDRIREKAVPVIDNLNKKYGLTIKFEQLYDRDEYDKKSMTDKKITDNLQQKINKVVDDMLVVSYFLPKDETEKAQVLDIYSRTLAVVEASKHADYLKDLHAQAENRKQQEMEEQATPPVIQNVDHAQEMAEAQEQHVQSRVERKVFEVIAVRPFFDEMNQLILKYKPQVKVLESE